jgi:DNA replication and repair protein RecF
VTTAYLTDLSLAQFRSYAQVSLHLDGRPVVLVGPNGAGKTNLLEAVSLLSPGRGLRGATAAEMARQPGTLGWRLRASLSTARGVLDIVLTGEPEGRRRVEIDGKAATQARLGQLVPVLWLTPAMDRLWLDGAEGRRRFIDRAALSFEPSHAEAALRYEGAMRERNRLLKDGPADPGWLSALEAQMAESGVRLSLARLRAAARLNAAQAYARTLFPRAGVAMVGSMESAFTHLSDEAPADAGSANPQVSAIAADFAARLARGRREDAAAGRTLHGPHRSDLDARMADKEMPARLCSTGEQKALLLSLILANARALAATGNAPILLLDEVVAHLDDSRRAALLAEIAALGGQAFLTGTDAAAFAQLGDAAQVLAVRESANGSTVAAV